MTISKSSQCYVETSENLRGVLEGVSICFDPSIGSSSSQPGYSVRRAGKHVASGIMEIPAHESVPERLRRLHNHVRKLYNEFQPDVCIYEQIPAQRQGGGNARSHASLLMALGVILSVPGPTGHIGIYPVSWRKLTSVGYIKGDEADAIEIHRIIWDLAREIHETRTKKGTTHGRKTKGTENTCK